MKNKQTFVRSLFFGIDSNLQVINAEGLLRRGNLMFKLELVISGVSGEYTGVMLTVIGLDSQAKITQTTFNFDDYLLKDAESRKTDRFSIVTHCGWDWYIMVPSEETLTLFRANIAAYIAQFVQW